MKTSTRIATAVGAVGLAAVVGAVAVTLSTRDAPAEAQVSAESRPAAVTSFPGLETADGEPWLASLESASPEAGTVAEASGPFDDRFEFHDLALADGRVTGEVVVTSDVSEILELEVLAGFYDAEGTLVGDGAFVVGGGTEHTHEEGATPVESYLFEVSIPADVTTAVSAAVGVPVLVNE
jgi:hypothetical protein